MVKPVDIAWLAAIIEGEGAIAPPKLGTSLQVVVAMTDEDTVDRVARLMNSTIRGPVLNKAHSGKPTWTTAACGNRGAGVLMTIYSFMSIRRRAQIRAALAAWRRQGFSPGPHTSYATSRKFWDPQLMPQDYVDAREEKC